MSGDGSRERGAEILDAAAAERDPDPLLAATPAPEGPLLDTEPVIPDHTRSIDEPPTAPPTEEPKRRRGLGLGANRKRGSGVRQLTKSDRDKIVGLYITCGFGVMLVNQSAAQTIAEQSDACADAWVELARENDSVRRSLLFLIEGGAWGAVFVAHLPIALAFLPDEYVKSLRLLAPPRIPNSPGEGNGSPMS